MCQEHFQEWKECKCRGFYEIKICPELFKTCLGPSGADDQKKVVVVHAGRCNTCEFRAQQDARNAAQAVADAEGLSIASATTATPSEQPSMSRGTSYSSSTPYSSGYSDSTADR